MKNKILPVALLAVATLSVTLLLAADDTKQPVEKPDKLVEKFPRWKEARKLKGDAAAGKVYFETRAYGNKLTCVSCHSFNPDDTYQLDGDKQKRSANPIFASIHRTNIKNEGSSVAALGANICVLHFFREPEPGMTAQELADMDAFLHTGGNANHATAKNLDYANAKRTVPDKLTGGDAVRGKQLAQEQYCITCHTVDGKKYTHVQGSKKLQGGQFSPDKAKDVARRIRNPDFKVNEDMPGHDDLRMPEKDLLDILAWLTTPK